MIKIALIQTTRTGDGLFHQTWEVNGKQYRTVSEWGDIQFINRVNEVLIPPNVKVEHVIVLAIHGCGPTTDGESTEWKPEELVSHLREHGYLGNS